MVQISAPGAIRTHNHRLRRFIYLRPSRIYGGTTPSMSTYGGINCPMCASCTLLPPSLHVSCTSQTVSHPIGLPICIDHPPTNRNPHKYLWGFCYYLHSSLIMRQYIGRVKSNLNVELFSSNSFPHTFPGITFFHLTLITSTSALPVLLVGR